MEVVSPQHVPGRRAVLVGALCCLVPAARAAAQSSPRADRLLFDIRRGAASIGRHEVVIARGAEGEAVARIAAEFVVRVGPVPVYRYRHSATETWRAGRFASLQSETIENGGRREVRAERDGAGVRVVTGGREHRLAAEACPLTHWNAEALRQPLFNAQTGAAMAETVTWRDGRPGEGARIAALTGAAAMTDAYDADGRWLSLSLKAPDGSTILYRRL